MNSGARIGFYEIVAKLGEGGMGEVYRARDTKLDREVALKVLPDLFVSDPERLARFEREAKVLASLNHPNIAHIYGFEGHAIAMELVEGATLDEMLRGQESGLPLDRALPLMKQIAQALEAAHDQGIIHRDLKPANVKVREDGTVKVLDFGLAKAFAADAESAASGVSNSPTLTARSTQLGMILGTAAYMAPEQAKGRAVDRRADVWAFGVVFFEVLAGRRAFEGDDVSEVLASVLKMEPDWSALPADLPGPVRRLLRRCLEKDPKKRLRDVAEGMLQLEEGLASGSTASMMMPAAGDLASAAPPPTRSRWRMGAAIAGTAVVTAAAAIGINAWLAPAPAALEAVRFQFVPPVQTVQSVANPDIAMAPDGRSFVYVGVERLAALRVRRLDQLEDAVLRGSEGAMAPFFSPDSQWVGFLDNSDTTQVKKVSALGGPPTAVTKLTSPVTGAAWMTDGTIILGMQSGPLERVSEAGGTPEPLTTLDAQESDHLWPSAIRGTSLVLFVVNGTGRTPLSSGQLAVLDLSTRNIVRLGITGSRPKYVPSGHIVYAVEDGSLRAIRFDTGTKATSGTPVPVLDAVGVKASGAANFDVSDDGRMIYAGGGVGQAARTVVFVDRAGKETATPAEPRSYVYARFSPNGRFMTLDVRDQEQDIWIWDVGRESLQRLTDTPGTDQYGIWSPDSQRVVFSSTRTGKAELFWHRPDGVGQPEQITDTAKDKLTPFPNAITSDGKQVIFRATVTGNKNDLFVVGVGDLKSTRALLATPHEERNAALSNDGRFMAFESDLSGKMEVYVRPFPDVDRRQWLVSTAGGSEPVWAPSGRELFYLSQDNKLMAVPVTVKGVDAEFGRPTVLFDARAYYFGGVGRNYDVVPQDGRRFVMVKAPDSGSGANPPITVVLNWVDELRGRLK